MLEGLKWSPKWVTHMGCIKGCLNYLGVEVTDSWLYGGSGHALIINMAHDTCPSGPTAWKTMDLFRLGRNIGYSIDGVFAHKSMSDFNEKRKKAWEYVKAEIDKGHPCYGWELEGAEFYVINGYDNVGYYYNGPLCDERAGPKPWEDVGDTGIGIVEFYSVEKGTASEDLKTVKDVLEFALDHAKNWEKYTWANYHTGLGAYDNWINALETRVAVVGGMGYNSAVWNECRGYAVEFLGEAKERIDKETALFDEAIAHYKKVSENLKQVTEVNPFEGPDFETKVTDENKIKESIEALKRARTNEEKGLKSLEKLVKRL